MTDIPRPRNGNLPPGSTVERLLPKQYGETLIVNLHRVFKGAVYYDRKNTILVNTVQECRQVMTQAFDAYGHIDLRVVRDTCFLNNIRVHISPDLFGIFKAFIQDMRKLWIGGIEFDKALTEEELADIAFILHDLEEGNESNYLVAKRRLTQIGVTTIDVVKLEVYNDELSLVDSEALKRQSKEVYFTTIDLVKQLMDDSSNKQMLNVRRAKRLMLNAVDMIVHDESTLLGLTNIKSYDAYTFNHSVNVAIYAIALGQRVGIPKKYLNYLGMAGLFHDIGKLQLSDTVMRKTTPLTEAELVEVQNHPVLGAESIMKMRGWGELASRMMAVAYEHHLKHDGTGYPTLSSARRPTLFSRIVAIVDFYDVMGRPRENEQAPCLSERIIEELIERSGTDFDPVLVKIFVNMIGIYPMGTLLQLDTGELAIVIHVPEDTEHINRPRVCLLRKEKNQFCKGAIVELSEHDEQKGGYKRNILWTLNPNDYKINIEEFFL